MSGQDVEWTLTQLVDQTSGASTIIRRCVKLPVSPGDLQYGWIAYLTFLFQPRDGSGLPASADNDALHAIEELEIPKLEADGLGIFVAVVLSGGVKDFLFYTRDPKVFLEKAALIRDGQTRFRVGCEIAPDADWSQYTELE